MYNVFLSYLRDDKAQALRLAEELKSNGAAVWVDVSDLMIGATWREEIATAIRRAEFFVACFSSTYEERPDNGMLDELKYVISLRKAGEKHPEILPVKLNECDIPDLRIDSDRNLKELHWYLLDDQNWQAGVKQLLEITLRMAKARAKVRLRKEAEEVAAKNAQLVRAREELITHNVRILELQRARETSRHNSTGYSRDWGSSELSNMWPAQNVARRELEDERALSKYRKHQVEFVQRFDEDYHPLGELTAEMHAEEKRIQQSFARERRAEDARIAEAQKGLMVLFVLMGLLITIIGLLWGWLKSC